jgi:hypothetical protein
MIPQDFLGKLGKINDPNREQKYPRGLKSSETFGGSLFSREIIAIPNCGGFMCNLN